MADRADLKMATSFGSGRPASELVLTLLKDGLSRKQLDLLRARLSRAKRIPESHRHHPMDRPAGRHVPAVLKEATARGQ